MITPRKLGAQGPDVFPIGFGAMHLSIDQRPDDAQSIKTLHACWEAGITLIDTADAYCLDDTDTGHNERLIAKALASYAGDQTKIVIATKGGCVRPGGAWERDGRPEHLRNACEASLNTLGVQQIALYQLHAVDPKTPLEDSMGELVKLQREGKIRWIGLSNVKTEQIKKAQTITPIASVQNRHNLYVDQLIGNDLVNYCETQGIAFLPYNPVGGRRLVLELGNHPLLKELSRKHRASPAAIVLAWLLALSPVMIPIPGSRSLEHARDSAGACSIILSEEDLKNLGQAEFKDPSRS